MIQSATIAPIGAALSVTRPISIDDAVRAALSHRPAEARCFGNEDDMEGPRREVQDARASPPAA